MIANIKPDQLDDPTPCQSWAVRDICNHLVGGSYYFAEIVNGTSTSPSEEDFTTGNMVASYDEGIKQAVAAFGAPGAIEKSVTLPFGDLPAVAWLGIATTDQFTHALGSCPGDGAGHEPRSRARGAIARRLQDVHPTRIPR